MGIQPQSAKDAAETKRSQVGMIAIKMDFTTVFEGNQEHQVPARLVCYGSLPLKQDPVSKLFEGAKCHVKFLLWAMQNVTDYKKDNREDST